MKYTLHPVEFPIPPNLQMTSGPRLNTTLFEDGTGNSQPQGNWEEALWRLTLQFRRYSSDWDDMIGFYLARRGPLRAFWFTDPLDNTDNGRGKVKTINGVRYLVKEYPDEYSPYNRIIAGATDVVFSGVGGSPTYELGTGKVTGASSDGTATFAFKVPVAFTSDVFELTRNAATGDWQGVVLDEIRSFTIAGGS